MPGTRQISGVPIRDCIQGRYRTYKVKPECIQDTRRTQGKYNLCHKSCPSHKTGISCWLEGNFRHWNPMHCRFLSFSFLQAFHLSRVTVATNLLLILLIYANILLLICDRHRIQWNTMLHADRIVANKSHGLHRMN